MKKLYDMITADTWCKGIRFDRENKQRCLMGWLDRQYGEYPDVTMMIKKLRAMAELQAAIIHYSAGRYRSIVPFNDADETTVEDVRQVCKIANQ